MIKNKEKKVKKRKNISITTGIVKVCATFNNTIISITDLYGNVVCWSSPGKLSFKGSKKSTPYASQVSAKDVISRAKEMGLKSVSVEVRGPGAGREACLRALQELDINVSRITDKTHHPHNGCRAPKRRRV
jgi:small subunit ribosomal protein S11|tara:strand:- start:13028 stop:13420 length:393 start_codon:yes stop_codon:yes gene_type:complete